MFKDQGHPNRAEKAITDDDAQPDDFLRIEAHNADSESDLEAFKDDEVDLRDIHLEALRTFKSTLYMDIYGIPETWLSLLSQTTRLANIMDFIEQTKTPPPRAFSAAMHRKITKLEQTIASFQSRYCLSRAPSPPVEGHNPAQIPNTRTNANSEMLQAMGAALVIFFHRRVRKSHAWMLQGHVDDVVAALQGFDSAQDPGSGRKIPGTPFPAFVAGCEAMSQTSRSWLLGWMQRGESMSAFSGFASSQWVMRKVWEGRDSGVVRDADQGLTTMTMNDSQHAQTY